MLSYCVTTLDGKELLSLSPSEVMRPASNTKLFTCALALENFEATESPAPALDVVYEDKKLQINFHGNLFFSARYRDKSRLDHAFKQIAEAILKTGIQNFDSLHLYCEAEFLSPLKDYPCVSFISINENTLDLAILDGELEITPESQSSFKLSACKTIEYQSRTDSQIFYNPNQDSEDFWRLEGSNWTYDILVKELRKLGLFIAKQSKKPLRNPQLIGQFADPITTQELITSSLRFSDNFRAELLALHLRKSQKNSSIDQCLKPLKNKLQLKHTQLTDGSGLDRLNKSSCEDICSLLRYMHHSKHSEIWHQSMAISGEEGTLSNSNKNQLPKKRFWGKTGTLRDTRALSGYYKTENGSIVIVSVLQNHANCSKFSESVIKLLREIDEEQTNSN
ncbi:D-alanyl-D-alanine carboxypeptidase [Lentisphaera marina]|uniref:D-alanyl-D-alanine carboxypeptidase n=1 Tax=Lentisphaera marina TaxID=1111041 RepID=UPI002365447C|nr:D-alanyl-D-alanine carboxypeptidase [Lentisphaera marina]MDD7987095.1 D-alanyl-D-alanine carboxypeptidase [Lentisphaera marina]